MIKTNILITGATGILGRHVLYELLRQYADGQKKGKLIVIIRSKSGQTGHERLVSIVRHRFRPAYLDKYNEDELLKHIVLIEAAIEELTNVHLEVLGNYNNFYVIHAAAETDLSNTAAAHEKVFTHNYLATKHILQWVTPRLYRFIFISTTFSKGRYNPVVSNQYISFDENHNPVVEEILQHRIPYEEFKIKMELELIQYCQQHEKNGRL
ncbi:hypothetical protein BOQ62_00400 [Chryseobacterium sp. CH21]|uniref:SDR family oxidoreductase n=1 Tax=Chryseobacterium sp. CH21 TaxID=713556 RepID=UPI00100ADBBD|nr:SDR family oxidoreductase [Chryseobacterium sp. CH21]RXM41444.1 hypothetical protein BOQ62_00400 [Chryseobacterium sp. CH21]